ncbi:hypothetical protein Agub_g6351, partial [Astrephomene gubernaculifera]
MLLDPARRDNMPIICKAAVAVILGLLFIEFQFTSAVQEQRSLGAALERSALLANTTTESKNELLGELAVIVRAPVYTRLRLIHELQHGHTRSSIRQILESFPTLNEGNLERWFSSVDTFLTAYAQGTASVSHGPVRVDLNQTALSGLPLIRRTLLAQLVTAWLTSLQRKLPDKLEAKVAKMVQQLYELHRASVVQKGAMEYFHISKAGGTSWNSAAKLNGCQAAHAAGSHVRGFGDECRWMNQTVYKKITGGRRILWGRWGRVARDTHVHGCVARWEVVAGRGFSYISNEYTLQGGLQDMYDTHTCPQLVNVVTLRDPLRRMESAIRFIMMHVKRAFTHNDPRDGETTFNSLFCNASVAFWEALAPPITDNYLLRSFLGELGFHTPLGGLNATHGSVARHLLLQFDLVLDLDAGERANDEMAYGGLGWPSTLSRAHALDGSVLAGKMDLDWDSCQPAGDAMRELRARQRHDVAFYRFGRVVSRLDALWLDMARSLGLAPLARMVTAEAEPQEIG